MLTRFTTVRCGAPRPLPGLFFRIRRPQATRFIHNRRSNTSQQQIYLCGKSEDDITQTLQRLNFFQLPTSPQSNIQFVYTYLKKLNVMGFNRTSTHLNRFYSELKREKSMDNNDVTLYSLMIKYLMEEAELEVQRLNQFGSNQLIQSYLDNIQLKEAQQTKEEHKEDVETFIMDNIFPSSQETDQYPYLSHLSSLFHILDELRINNKIKWEQYLSIDQVVSIFELSKLISLDIYRERGIFLSSSLLYSNDKITMDPINESFYINSLIKFGQFKKAFKLFQSRKDTLREDNRWWGEIGLKLSLINNNLRNFQKLLFEMDMITPIYLSPKILTMAIKKYSMVSTSNNIKLNQLLNRFIQNIETYGIMDKPIPSDNNNKMTNFNDESEAIQFLNKIELISYHDIIKVINSLLYHQHIGLVGPFLDKILSLENIDPRIWEMIIIKTKLKLLKDFNSIKSILPKINESDSKLHNLSNFERKFKKITSKYVKKNDPMINFLLFNNIDDLVSNYKLPLAIEKIMTERLTSSYNPLNLSKSFNILLKAFLSSHNISKAQELVEVMERMSTDETFALENKDKYPPIDISHYTTLISYYTNKRVNHHKSRKWDANQKKVIDIVNKVNTLGIHYNSAFITRLLIFYRENKDFNRCFQIINETLKTMDNNNATDQEIKNQRTILKKSLYFEFWKVYYQYYNLQTINLITTGNQTNIKNLRSKYNNFKKDSTIQPHFDLSSMFNIMISKDYVLPNLPFVKLILTTFMKAQHWTAIPAVITQLTQVFNIEFDNDFIKTLIIGIKKEFIMVETHRLMNKNPGLTFTKARIRARAESTILGENSDILKLSSSEEKISQLMGTIFLLLKYKNPFDREFNEVKQYYQTLNLMELYPETIVQSCS